MIGRLVGNYRVVAKLGAGGMGDVYLAEHPDLGRKQAIKVLHSHLLRDGHTQVRFLNEARAASALRHPNIVEITDVGTLQPEGTPYIMMEHLVGEELAARIRQRGRLAIDSAVELAAQIAAALGVAHARGIVHRDLKPANLFVVADDRRPGSEKIKVLDFGVAKLQGALAIGSAQTESGLLLGTPMYMSPEQCHGAREVDHRSDIYSLGLILYEMVCGVPPFQSNAIGEMVLLHTTQAPESPRRHNPAIPASLEQVILRALAKDPDRRFGSAAELQAALELGAPGWLPSAASGGYAAIAAPVSSSTLPSLGGYPASGGFGSPPGAAVSMPQLMNPGPIATPLPAPIAMLPLRASTPVSAAPHAGGFATRSMHYSVIAAPALPSPASVRTSRTGLWALLAAACLAVAAVLVVVLGRSPASDDHKAIAAVGSSGSGSAGSGSSAAKLVDPTKKPALPKPSAPRPPTPKLPDAQKRIAGSPAEMPGPTAPAPAPKPPAPAPQPAPPAPLPAPSRPEPASAADACARNCRRLASCGFRPSATCEQSCAANPAVSRCAAAAADDCNGAASCAVANQCGGIAPSGAASCHATFECELRCGTDAACSCHCAQLMAPSHAKAWLTKRQCAAACRGDAGCIQTRCSRSILACQAD